MVNARLCRFTIGELEPLLKARNDFEPYSSALDKARNVIIIPEGGIKRRPGSVYIDTVPGTVARNTTATLTMPNGGSVTNVNNFVNTSTQTTTAIGTNNPYVVASYDLGATGLKSVYVDLMGVSLTSGASNTFYIQSSTDNVTWINIKQVTLTTTAQTVRIRLNNYARYVRFASVGSVNLPGTYVNILHMHVYQETNTVSKTRIIEFIHNINQSYIFVVSDKNIAVYKNRVFQNDISTVTDDTTMIDEAKLATLNWTRAGLTLVLMHEDLPPHRIFRMGGDNLWGFAKINFDYIPLFDFRPSESNPVANITPSALTGQITVASNNAIFDASYVNQVIDGNGGRIRITKFNSATSLNAIVEIPFYNTNTINSPDWTLLGGWEPAWSDTRGWPRSGVFYQERLWFGGSKSCPITIWGSVTEDYYNFNPGSFRDTDAYDRDLETSDPIINMIAHQTLQAFTTGGEAAAILRRGAPLTPTTPGFMPQTRRGSAIGLRPVVSDSVILFVQYGGKNISQLMFSEENQAFNSLSLTLYSSHLINAPNDFNLKRSQSTAEGNYVYIVNGDGALTTGCLLFEQNIQGFTQWNTQGLYRNVGVDYGDVYLTVDRVINGVTYKYLEVVDDTHMMDASIVYNLNAPTSTLTGLNHLNGLSVSILVDGNVLENQVVVNGQINLPIQAQATAEVGLNFTPLIRTLPYENLQLVGETIGQHKRVQEVYLWINNTGEVFVNDYLVSLKDYGGVGVGPLDAPAPLRDGLYRLSGIEGWNEYGQITLTQVNPLPMTILAIGMRVTI